MVKCSSFPRFKIIVMNRNSKDNLEVPVTSKFQMQVREPYLIFRLESGEESGRHKIRGIWFHDGKERETIVEMLNRVVKSSSAADETMTKHTCTHPQHSTNEKATATINKEKAAASLMAALKIGDRGGSSSTEHENCSRQQNTESESSVQNMVLDKKSLQLSLMSLLQEDKFLDLIHAQYLKVAKARAAAGRTAKK